MLTTAAEPRPPAEPDGAPRLPVLDVLRGIAILGILFMNVNDMGAAIARSMGGEPWQLGWSAADQVAWWIREVLANGTARCLLEMLFGVGMVILTDRAATRMGEWQLLRAYWTRNIVLFLFGVVHVLVLLWPGDILHTYGIAALIAVLFRRLRPRLLLCFGLALAVLELIAGGAAAIDAQQQRATAVRLQAKVAAHQMLTAAEHRQLADYRGREGERATTRADMARMIADEDRARTGTASSWARSAWTSFRYVEQQLIEVMAVWEAAGTMLIGAAMFRLGIIQGARTRRWYRNMTAIAYAVGLTCRIWTAAVETRFDQLPSLAYATTEFARLATTLGHLGLVNLMLMTPAGARVLRPFAAAGRTALSIYVAQTLLCLWVLYPPWGLALYAQQGWAAMMATALAIDAALLLLAMWWVRHFAVAPVEWAWRSIIAARRLPFRLHADAVC